MSLADSKVLTAKTPGSTYIAQLYFLFFSPYAVSLKLHMSTKYTPLNICMTQVWNKVITRLCDIHTTVAPLATLLKHTKIYSISQNATGS